MNSLDGLRSLLGVDAAVTTAAQQPKSTTNAGAATTGSALSGDRATLSSTGSEVSLTAAEPDVRMDKVSAIQSALASGTYNVPASAVASSVVSSMLGARQ